MADKYLQQCKLKRDDSYQMLWIPERGAKAGAYVELLPNDGKGKWRVMEVFHTKQTEQEVKDKSDKSRNAFASIR